MQLDVEASPRERIVRAAYQLLSEGGRDAVSTRAVTAAAGVQAPTIYRQFGDMSGLLAEVANYGFSSYLASKRGTVPSDDPVADLREGWNTHVAFGLAQPAVYALMYGDPRPGPRPAAVQQARQMLRTILERVAEAGRLQVPVDQALDMVDATGAGVVLHLLDSPPQDRDATLATAVREAVLGCVTLGSDPATSPDSTSSDPTSPNPSGSAVLAARSISLKAVLGADSRLSDGERQLLGEWLDRLSTPVGTDEPSAQ